MSDFETQTQKLTSAVEKAIGDLTARVETAVSEMSKLQAKSVEQANLVIETTTRITQDNLAFAEQVGGELKKLVLAATRGATDLITPKK
jgi:methyl-accepting chemotaxis protein